MPFVILIKRGMGEKGRTRSGEQTKERHRREVEVGGLKRTNSLSER